MPPRINAAARYGAAVGRALRRPSSVTPKAAALLENSGPITSRYIASASGSRPLNLGDFKLPEDYIPPTQPPSARRPEFRKSQLLRSYTSMLRSTPLMLLFQHNNLTGNEWSAVRREMRLALAALPAPEAGPDGQVPVDISDSIHLKLVKTRMFSQAFKIVEFFDAEAQEHKSNAYTHDLSQTAYDAVKAADVEDPNSAYAQISPLLVGQVAALTFPAVSPAHLAAMLKILAPSPAFPAPTRKKNPGYHEVLTQNGLSKLILLGGRIEGKVFDTPGVNWVGGIEGGLGGLQAQLVHMLQSAGMGLTTALEGQSKNLWLTMESRRTQMEEEANPGSKSAAEEGESTS